MSNETTTGTETDSCGYCGKSGTDTWKITTPNDFGWDYECDCETHTECSNCGYPL